MVSPPAVAAKSQRFRFTASFLIPYMSYFIRLLAGMRGYRFCISLSPMIRIVFRDNEFFHTHSSLYSIHSKSLIDAAEAFRTDLYIIPTEQHFSRNCYLFLYIIPYLHCIVIENIKITVQREVIQEGKERGMRDIDAKCPCALW